MELLKLGVYLRSLLRGVTKFVVHEDFLVLHVKKEALNLIVSILKNHSNLKFDYAIDCWGVDYPELDKRFEINYMLCSLTYNVRIILKVNVEENEGVPSLNEYYNSLGWLEREVWDMFGVYFYGNKDLRRILTDYGFEGYPLRKDFPLSGFVEVRYDDAHKRVVQEPLEIAQEYRLFNFKSPWE